MTRTFVAFVLIATLLGAGVSHALVPHAHSHDHTQGESVIWSTLHSSLRHEDKKLLVASVEGTLLSVLAFVVFTGALVVSRRRHTNQAEEDDMSMCDALRKGIYRYRAFG